MWAVLLYMLRHRLWSQRHCFNPLCVCFVSSDNWCESLLLNQSPVKERIHWILYNSFHIPLVINLQCPMSLVEFARNSAYVSIANKKCLYCTALQKWKGIWTVSKSVIRVRFHRYRIVCLETASFNLMSFHYVCWKRTSILICVTDG